jgi:hypothetical protein
LIIDLQIKKRIWDLLAAAGAKQIGKEQFLRN